MPRRVTSDQAAQYWVTGMGNSATKVKDGIARVTQAPGQKAAAKRDKYLAGVTNSVNLWAQRTAAVDLGTWQAAATAGADRIGSGASAKQSKYAAAVAPVFSFMDTVLSRVDAMPDTTLDQRIAKSTAFQQGMAQYKQRAGA